MLSRFHSFVVFAEMRTGSNLLEDYLNQIEGVTCHGEAFNPNFIGYPNTTDILGITQGQRETDPISLFHTIQKATFGIGGFRYFHDHDPRILSEILTDASCAKIVLTRNPLDSYVSLKIARETDQWKLTNVANRKDAKVWFDVVEFRQHLEDQSDFQALLKKALQVTGQSAFYIDYDDLHDQEVLTGLAQWLGVTAPEGGFSSNLKPQNPLPVAEKVENPNEMAAALSNIDPFAISNAPNFEPRRGPVVPAYIAHPGLPLLYMPIRSGPEDRVVDWLKGLSGDGGELIGKFSQKSLKSWMADHPGHRRFTVLRHPLRRAHAAFCSHILNTGPGAFLKIRQRLIKHHGLDLPENPDSASYTLSQHLDAFTAFLKFLKLNLSGQTSIRVDAHWSSQVSILQGMAEFCPPDQIVREDEMDEALARIALQVGISNPPQVPVGFSPAPYRLEDIYSDSLEQLCRSAYGRDYQMLGFGNFA